MSAPVPVALAAGAAVGIAWAALAVGLRPREPRRGTALTAAGLLATALAAAASATVPGWPARAPAAIALLAGVVLARGAPWERRVAPALAASALAVALAPLAAPSWAPVGVVAGLAAAHAVVYVSRPAVFVPGVARALAALAAAAAAAGVFPEWGAPALLATAAVTLVALELLAPRLVRWPRPSLHPKPPQAGDLLLSRYRVVRPLGEGAHGATFLARDELEGGPVAIKWLKRAGSVDPGLLEEARALGSIAHPNVVALADAGSDEGAGTVLVMEFVSGGGLHERLARGPLGLPAFEPIALGLLDGLAAVHHAGFVHRDVKPSNVLLTAEGRPKLADFGISRLPGVEETAGDATGGPPVGTARYMSPEQAKGRRGSPASDLYSAGVTLLEALAGTPVAAATSKEGPGEAGPAPRELPPSLAAFVPVFETALAEDPRARYRDAAEMRAALAAACDAARRAG